MNMHCKYVSASEAGDYCQVLFEEQAYPDDTNHEDEVYFLIQRQFEFPDNGYYYVESHDEAYRGHFRFSRAKLSRSHLQLQLSRQGCSHVEITFETSDENYTEAKRILQIIIPALETLE